MGATIKTNTNTEWRVGYEWLYIEDPNPDKPELKIEN
jgi:hypothetical protein